MSSFDFLKNFNPDLYEIALKLENDVINSPRAVPADATVFLESIVKDIYRLSGNKMKANLHSFYKKINLLYRLRVIPYNYKNKLQDAYNLRNIIHSDNINPKEESDVAYDLHERLFYISKKYYLDFCDDCDLNNSIEYRKPSTEEIHFKNCIICGSPNNDLDLNMCSQCSAKVDLLKNFKSIQKSLYPKEEFKKEDLLNNGISESLAISLILNFTNENLIEKRFDTYYFNKDGILQFEDEINRYFNISMLLNNLYKKEISPQNIIQTEEYQKGYNENLYREFHRLVDEYLIIEFEESLINTNNLEKSMKLSTICYDDIYQWFLNEKDNYINGYINESFNIFNDLLIKDYFNYMKKGLDEIEICDSLHITSDIYDFWINNYCSADFYTQTVKIKKSRLIKELKKNKTLEDALSEVKLSKSEFDEIYNNDSKFFKQFNSQYLKKRQKLFIKHLKKKSLDEAIKKANIEYSEFKKWYFEGEENFNDFYIKTTKILMKKYLNARLSGKNKSEILPKEIIDSWNRHDWELFRKFQKKNLKITSDLLKRGLVLNAINDDKTLKDALNLAKITHDEFMEIYNISKKAKTNYYIRFDEAYKNNRKRLFLKLLSCNDFFNAIQKSEITQKEFHKWYSEDKKEFLKENNAEFYTKTTEILMDKYLFLRKSGKNRPDAARSVGLENTEIALWLRKDDIGLFKEFQLKHKEMEINILKEGFKNSLTKTELSKRSDISINEINRYLSDIELYRIYYNNVIPKQLEQFLNEVSKKPLKKVLKNCDLTLDDVNSYYNLGRDGDDDFTQFYNDYLEAKVNLYIESIISKKPHKISLKNSNLSPEEYEENKHRIDDKVLDGRINIIFNGLIKNFSIEKLANNAGVSAEEIYDWYLKGKQGDDKYGEFASVFELTRIIPRVMAVNRAKAMGLSKSKLMRNLKKDMGKKEFSIWQKHGIIDKFDEKFLIVDAEGFDNKKALEIIKNSEFIKCCQSEQEEEMINFMKKAFMGNSEFLNYKLSNNNPD